MGKDFLAAQFKVQPRYPLRRADNISANARTAGSPNTSRTGCRSDVPSTTTICS